MPDIQLRFNKDMLVLSAPLDAMLARQGIDAARDRQYLNLMEPDAIHDALNLEVMAGAHCLVTTTEDITQARLAHVRMDGSADQLAKAALSVAAELKPQHILAEIGPCGLPLDPSSKSSLNENRKQYADAARAFEEAGPESFDAFFLNGFTNIVDMKCALMGAAQVSGKPVFASFTIGETPLEPVAAPDAPADVDGTPLDGVGPAESFEGFAAVETPTFPGLRVNRAPLPLDQWPEAVAAMEDLGAAVVGFETADGIPQAEAYARQAAALTNLPLLAQFHVRASAQAQPTRGLTPLDAITDYTPDTMERAALRLFAAGAQFLRATGAATPAFTGALAATVMGVDVRPR